ncbi:MAG TPA: two-component system sensor histidine kinase AtoS [Desulfotomaculum sp.]|nr:two-component system sensor histidine kinase AtoS [Desulfotomaculum sp.]
MLRSHTLGNQLLILIAILLLFPVLLTLYMLHVIQNSELALVEYQKAKLGRALDELDNSLQGSLNDILAGKQASGATRAEKIRILNEALKDKIEQVSASYPQVEMGFYSLELDAILDGSENYEENFSKRRKALFQEALSRQQTVVQTIGHTSAGVLETYKPFYRNGRLEGIVWAYENMAQTNFYKRVKTFERNAYLIIAAGVIIGLGGTLLLIRNFVRNVNQIKQGVKKLEYDLLQRLPETPGELGEISRAVNKLACRLVEVHKYNEIMMATIDDGLVVINAAGRVIIVNTAAAQMLGMAPDWPDRHYQEVFPEGSPFADLLTRTLENNEQLKDLLIPWHQKGNGTQQILVSTAPMVDHRGETIGAVLCCRDVTERMRLEERAHRQERLAALGKLVAGVAHEIRNPLTSISCYIQLWQKTNNPSPKSIRTIYEEVTRLETLVAQLLYFTKPAEARFGHHDLNQLVEKVLQFFTEIHLARFTLVRRLGENLPPAWMDPNQMERVLMNIIFNACQAMPDGGTLTVATHYHPEEDWLEVTVSDTGCGIPAENLKQLFDPFFSTREKGIGLGLAIAHEIVQAHGGQIEVESEVGRGTTFRVYLRTPKDGEPGA